MDVISEWYVVQVNQSQFKILKMGIIIVVVRKTQNPYAGS